MSKVFVSASVEPAFQNELNYIEQIKDYVDFIHCDVMDGKFVENTRLSPELVKEFNANTVVPLDVHLMMEKPLKAIKHYAKSGANIITIHFESFTSNKDRIKALKLIRKHKCLAGLSIKPSTHIGLLQPFFKYIDLLLVMSVEPGKSGQSFQENTYKKIKVFDRVKRELGYNFLIEVDGGINSENAGELIKNGANILVSGNYLFKSENKLNAVKNLKGID